MGSRQVWIRTEFESCDVVFPPNRYVPPAGYRGAGASNADVEIAGFGSGYESCYGSCDGRSCDGKFVFHADGSLTFTTNYVYDVYNSRCGGLCRGYCLLETLTYALTQLLDMYEADGANFKAVKKRVKQLMLKVRRLPDSDGNTILRLAKVRLVQKVLLCSRTPPRPVHPSSRIECDEEEEEEEQRSVYEEQELPAAVLDCAMRQVRYPRRYQRYTAYSEGSSRVTFSRFSDNMLDRLDKQLTRHVKVMDARVQQIQRAWRRAISNPAYAMCRKRLLSELGELGVCSCSKD